MRAISDVYKSIYGNPISESMWVVSYFNTGQGLKGKITGHAVILIEGIINGELFIRQCDFLAMPIEKLQQLQQSETSCMDELWDESFFNEAPFANEKGVITNIRIFDSYYKIQKDNQNTSDLYNEFSHRTWEIPPKQAKKILDSIMRDKERTDMAKKGKCDYIPYQFAGNRRLFCENDGTNCPTWCFDKLHTGGIYIPPLPMDKLKAMPEKHVKAGAETLEFTTTSCCVM